MKLFSITRINHADCLDCEAMAHPAVAMARVTGSVESAYGTINGHGARVARVERAA